MRLEGWAEHACGAAFCPWFETPGRKGDRAPHHDESVFASTRPPALRLATISG